MGLAFLVDAVAIEESKLIIYNNINIHLLKKVLQADPVSEVVSSSENSQEIEGLRTRCKL